MVKTSQYPADFVLGELVDAGFIEKDGRYLPAIIRDGETVRFNSNPRSCETEGEAFSVAERHAEFTNKPEMDRRHMAEKQAAHERLTKMNTSDPA